MNAFIRLIVSLTAVQWLRRTSSIWLVPFVVLSVVWIAHSEFLSFLAAAYPEPSTAKSWALGIAYLLKWGITFLVFLWILFRSKRRRQQEPSILNSSSQNKSTRSSKTETKQGVQSNQNDGFDFLRNKKRLESRSDKILKGKDISDGPSN